MLAVSKHDALRRACTSACTPTVVSSMGSGDRFMPQIPAMAAINPNPAANTDTCSPGNTYLNPACDRSTRMSGPFKCFKWHIPSAGKLII